MYHDFLDEEGGIEYYIKPGGSLVNHQRSCNKCMFAGTVGNYDFYFCQKTKNSVEITVRIRYDYYSWATGKWVHVSPRSFSLYLKDILEIVNTGRCAVRTTVPHIIYHLAFKAAVEQGYLF